MKPFHTQTLIAAVLLPILLFSGCKKEDEDEPEEAPASNASQVSISDAAIVKMNVNGSTVTLQAGGSISELFDSDITGGPAPDTSAAVYLAGFENGGDDLFKLQMGTLEFVGTIPNTTEFQDFFAPGTRVLAQPLGGIDGVTMQWWNGSDQWFGTSCGAGPSGSFEITHIAQQQIGQDFYTKIRAVFSGTFFSCDGLAGDQTIGDGVLVLRFKNQP